MLLLDSIAIEQEARRLRAIEMQRMYGQLGSYLRASGHRLVARARAGLVALGHGLHLPSPRNHHGVGHKIANGH